jgi:carboxyl-terminal processing protease
MRTLDLMYVNEVDYSAMMLHALDRCKHIGQVLEKTNYDNTTIQFDPDIEHINLWQLGVRALRFDTRNIKRARMKHVMDILDEVLALNMVSLKLPKEILIAHFSEAVFDALDPYTTLIWPQQVDEFQKLITQKFSGIGVRISKAPAGIKVLSLIPDTPAYRSGLDAGDIIIAVNGESTENVSTDCAVRMISGPAGEPVTLTVKHPTAEKKRDIRIIRDVINVPTVHGSTRKNTLPHEESSKNKNTEHIVSENDKWEHMIDPVNHIGYIRISNFVEDTQNHVKQVIEELRPRELKGLVIDLRGNSGGLLISAVSLVDLFVQAGPILSSKARFQPSHTWSAHKADTYTDIALVVLIDEYSASASEILAGALQDPRYRRAVIVGSQSYGKGSVQEITNYTGQGSQFKMTTSFYHLPSGQPVKNRYLAEKSGDKNWGIQPDILVDLLPNERNKRFMIEQANRILTGKYHDPNSLPDTHSIQETIHADPQLAVGMIVLKSELIRRGNTVSSGLASDTRQVSSEMLEPEKIVLEK